MLVGVVKKGTITFAIGCCATRATACMPGPSSCWNVTLRENASDDGYAEENLWTGVGRARSGCGAAIVGDPVQVLAKRAMYREMGIEAVILSGYPHAAEADLFARHVLPRIDHAPLER